METPKRGPGGKVNIAVTEESRWVRLCFTLCQPQLAKCAGCTCLELARNVWTSILPIPHSYSVVYSKGVPIAPSRWEQLPPHLAPAAVPPTMELSLGLALYFHTCPPSRFLPPKSAPPLAERASPPGKGERASSLPRKMKLWPGDQFNPTPTFTPVSFLQSICPSSNAFISPSFAIAKPPWPEK